MPAAAVESAPVPSAEVFESAAAVAAELAVAIEASKTMSLSVFAVGGTRAADAAAVAAAGGSRAAAADASATAVAVASRPTLLSWEMEGGLRMTAAEGSDTDTTGDGSVAAFGSISGVAGGRSSSIAWGSGSIAGGSSCSAANGGIDGRVAAVGTIMLSLNAFCLEYFSLPPSPLVSFFLDGVGIVPKVACRWAQASKGE